MEQTNNINNYEINNKDKEKALQILLEMKNMNEQFFNYLQTIIDRNNELKLEYINTDEKNLYIIDEYNNNIMIIKKFIENLLKDINRNINDKCIHEIEEDDIDIDPDTSQRIKYCKKCYKIF